MKRLPRLDFLAPAPKPWAGLALVCAASLALLATALTNWQLDQGNRQAVLQMKQLAARAQPVARKVTEAERLAQAQAASVANELRAPWAKLLASFEQHGQAEIGLLKLEPDARSGLVRVTGQARSDKALFAYLQALEDDASLSQVSLTSHQTERETPGKPVRFALQASWHRAATAGKVQP